MPRHISIKRFALARENRRKSKSGISPVTFAVALQLITIRSVARARASRRADSRDCVSSSPRAGHVMARGATRISRDTFVAFLLTRINITRRFSPFTYA